MVSRLPVVTSRSKTFVRGDGVGAPDEDLRV